jgi:hypothetical protein
MVPIRDPQSVLRRVGVLNEAPKSDEAFSLFTCSDGLDILNARRMSTRALDVSGSGLALAEGATVGFVFRDRAVAARM